MFTFGKTGPMTMAEFDHLNLQGKKELLQTCCGSSVWVSKMIAAPAADDLVDILETSEEKWFECSREDWLEAFNHHPKIGDIASLKKKFAATAHFAADEQAAVKATTEDVLQALTTANKQYEEKFGFIFIVCATGKTAEEMLSLLQLRLANEPDIEINIAAEEQNSITKLRIEKLFL